MNTLCSKKCKVKIIGVSEHTKQPIQCKTGMVRRNDENMDEFKCFKKTENKITSIKHLNGLPSNRMFSSLEND